MSQQIPNLLFVGAGNIAQSIIKGILKAQPNAATQILATAPTSRNLSIIKQTLGCKTTLLNKINSSLIEFRPDYVFLCVKPQVLMASILKPRDNLLADLLKSIPSDCTTLSLLAGIRSETLQSEFNLPQYRIVRVMLNTAAEIGATSVIYHADQNFCDVKRQELEKLFKLLGRPVVRLSDENLMDVATGICGSGIAFFYEMIQAISDLGVKNGLSRTDATQIAAQLSKSAGEMLFCKKSHPYQLRDDVTSPAGTTINGLHAWHQNSTNQHIASSVQVAIDRARHLSQETADLTSEIRKRTI